MSFLEDSCLVSQTPLGVRRRGQNITQYNVAFVPAQLCSALSRLFC